MFLKRSFIVFIMLFSLSLLALIEPGCTKDASQEGGMSERIEMKDDKAQNEGEQMVTAKTEEDTNNMDNAPAEMDEAATKTMGEEEMQVDEEKAVEKEMPEETGKESVENPRVLIDTSMGAVELELFEKEAPITVKNFLEYTQEGFYDGSIFHRVISNFMIQGGGFTPDMVQKTTKPPIKNEASNKISNTKGTIAMARTQVIDSATSQFFINLKDNLFLDHKDDTARGYGYCVFGKVLKGMDVVEGIGEVDTTVKGHHRDVPTTPVVIKSVRIKK